MSLLLFLSQSFSTLSFYDTIVFIMSLILTPLENIIQQSNGYATNPPPGISTTNYLLLSMIKPDMRNLFFIYAP